MLRETSPQPIRRPPALADAAFVQLRADLLARGPLTAGRRLVAGDLASRLGMSRTPVREALDRLGRLGYLEPLDGGGYRRRRYRIRDIRDLYELRILLEPLGAELAATIGKPAVPEDTPSFHRDLARASGNRVLAHVVELLAERVSAMGTEGTRTGGPRRRSRSERGERTAHAAISDAIERGDGPAARAAMAEHLSGQARDLLGQRTSLHPATEAEA